MSDLSAETLFVQLPQPEAEPIDFFNIDQISAAPLPVLIDGTYHALHSATSTKDALLLWEIRLVLLLFNNQLPVAKKEAINLNNTLYLLENANAPKPVGASLDDIRTAQQSVIYPLPKNNDGEISFLLLILIMRLKSFPNLALVNELYKLCYQLRLRGTISEASTVQSKLMKLSYEVVLVLAITRNYLTLLSFLDSLRSDIKLAKSPDNEEASRTYYSNVTLVWLIVNILVHAKEKSGPELLDAITSAFESTYSEIEDSSWQSLKYVLQTFPPTTTGTSTCSEVDLSLPALVELVSSSTLSTRIICCTLAVWELDLSYTTTLENKDGKMSFSVSAPLGEAGVEAVYGNVMSRWGEYVHKVFGIE